MHIRRLVLPAALAAVLLLTIPIAAACGGDDDDDAGAHNDTAQVITAIAFLDSLGLHGIDDAINKDRTIPAGAAAKARKGQAVVKATAWPAELAGKADALAGILGEMAAALEGSSPDLEKAGAAAKKAHDAEHEFSDAAWAWIFTQAGVEGSNHGH